MVRMMAQDRHLRDAVGAGSADCEQALADMKARGRRPASGLTWYGRVQRDFASQREEN